MAILADSSLFMANEKEYRIQRHYDVFMFIRNIE